MKLQFTRQHIIGFDQVPKPQFKVLDISIYEHWAYIYYIFIKNGKWVL